MMNGINGVQMTGRMTIGLGKNMIGIMSGLVLLMIGLVTGLGLRTIGVLGLRTGPGTLRNGGIPLRPSHRARMVPRAQVRMSLRTPPRMNHHRMCQL